MVLTRSLLTFEVVAAITIRFVCCVNGSNTDHVCYREETYTEQVQVPVRQPVRVRSSNWCLEFPPRCSNYKTEIREVIKVQNVNKTRTIEFCCEGYARITIGNDTVCRPICRGGCGRGYCQAPNQCICDVGYTGSHCTQRCAHDRWGEGCQKICKCRNGSICDNKTGFCQCSEGWMGEMCEQPCVNGLYGLMCENICDCASNRCNPKTGECILDEHVTFIKPIITELPIGNTTKLVNERINATEWVRVETKNSSKSKLSENEKYQVLLRANTTSSAIETLNSTIANLTENIDKLTKNLDRQQEPATVLLPNTIMEITTVKPIQEVILIKPENVNPAIIVHQPAVLSGQEPKAPEVIHVITNWQQHLKANHQNESQTQPTQVHHEHDLSAVISILAIFSIVVLGAAVAFVVMYRRYLIRNRQNSSPTDPEDIQRAKTFTKPLPDLPGFTQNLTKTEVPQFYDRPSNNSAVQPTMAPYSYATASLYSVVTKNYPRKHSLEHLYDEIKYPPINNSHL